jgi:type I restriction enzyme R subunit
MSMTVNTKEIAFENFIEQQLLKLHGYKKRNPRTDYNKKLATDSELVLEFLANTQTEKFTKHIERFGKAAKEKLLQRLDDEITARGVLDVFRNGFEDRGTKFDMAYFGADSSFNKDIEARHKANILSIIRQLKYSEKNENSIDMVLFVNGLPVFSAELKNQMSGQNVQNSIAQYKSDRDPAEKLLSNMRSLVHFAIDTDLVFMTTRLDGHRTLFLPFNIGSHDGAGNPVNPKGHRTAYMWEDIWKPQSVMEIIAKFMTIERKESENKYGRIVIEKSYIFPRYHQLDTVRKIVVDARTRGVGKNYLVQHSAGSGKSNTIAWTAHRLSELYDKTGENKVFDSVIVITDRRALDKQLREIIEQFSQVRGVVKKIEEGGKQLKKALEDGEKIITTTLQKFPIIMDEIHDLPGKKFALIIDEAHSSQSGEGSKAVRKALKAANLDDAAKQDQDSREVDSEDLVNKLALAEQKARLGRNSSLSIFAFTATPKAKTLEIFGEEQTDGSYKPFSLYTMRQAIEEGFILDVLQNYTTYRNYFELVKTWQQDDKEYEKKKAQKLLFGYVDKHKHAINLKTKTITEHYHQHIAHLIDKRAKAMVVTKSRLHAVRYKQAFDAYLRESGLSYRTLVAFSGTVIDPDDGREYTEAKMNGFSEGSTVEEFKKPESKFLIVASKYQTGFDQPLLSAMYVDKRLGGVSAVQTLSRLNRTAPNKDETFVLDFVNEAEDILEAFQPYYTTTILSEATDQNLLYDLKRDIMAFKAFSNEEVEGFATEYFLGESHEKLNRSLDLVVERATEHMPEETKEFKSKINDFIKRYGFVSQVLLFEDTFFEKLYVFLKFLKRKLPIDKEDLPTEILKQVNINSLKVLRKDTMNIGLVNEPGLLMPMGGSSSTVIDIPDMELLSRIVADVNEKYGTEFTDADRIIANQLSRKFINNENLEGSINNNARDIAKVKFDQLFEKELVKMVNDHFDFYQKVNNDQDTHAYLKDRIFDMVYRKIKK